MADKHLTDAILRSYATGAAPRGVSLAASSHLTFCPSCRARLAEVETIAGAFLSADEPAHDVDFNALMSRIDEDEAPTTAPRFQRGPLPAAVSDAVGCDFSQINWKFLLPGVYEHEFLSEDGETVSLLKVRPGAKIPTHTHKAEELTVVFEGELVDGDVSYRAGDIAIADGEVNHQPQAGGDTDCICLAVLSGGLHFTGPFGRMLNLFT